MMFSHAFACAHANNEQLTKSDVLMVGDTLQTDILGANTFGLDNPFLCEVLVMFRTLRHPGKRLFVGKSMLE